MKWRQRNRREQFDQDMLTAKGCVEESFYYLVAIVFLIVVLLTVFALLIGFHVIGTYLGVS